MHPGLTFDLLRAQIDALHAVGINAPIYTTATWDELAATNHPEWRTVSPEGGSPRYLAGPNGGAGPSSTTHALRRLPLRPGGRDHDPLPRWRRHFHGYLLPVPSVPHTRRNGWTNSASTDVETDRHRFTTLMVEEFFDRIDNTVHKHNPKDAPLLQLRPHPARRTQNTTLATTPISCGKPSHRRLGYDHFPLTARYVE